MNNQQHILMAVHNDTGHCKARQVHNNGVNSGLVKGQPYAAHLVSAQQLVLAGPQQQSNGVLATQQQQQQVFVQQHQHALHSHYLLPSAANAPAAAAASPVVQVVAANGAILTTTLSQLPALSQQLALASALAPALTPTVASAIMPQQQFQVQQTSAQQQMQQAQQQQQLQQLEQFQQQQQQLAQVSTLQQAPMQPLFASNYAAALAGQMAMPQLYANIQGQLVAVSPQIIAQPLLQTAATSNLLQMIPQQQSSLQPQLVAELRQPDQGQMAEPMVHHEGHDDEQEEDHLSLDLNQDKQEEQTDDCCSPDLEEQPNSNINQLVISDLPDADTGTTVTEAVDVVPSEHTLTGIPNDSVLGGEPNESALTDGQKLPQANTEGSLTIVAEGSCSEQQILPLLSPTDSKVAAAESSSQFSNPPSPATTISHTDANTVDGINLEEIKNFAKAFKLRRLSLGLTQTQVGQALSSSEGPSYSQSAICRFEKLDITPKSAQKIKPVLERWMQEAEEHFNGNHDLTFLTGSEPARKRKHRTSFTPAALQVLNKFFETSTHPSGPEMTSLAEKLNYDREVVRVWFCNKRQALKNTIKKLKTTEIT